MLSKKKTPAKKKAPPVAAAAPCLTIPAPKLLRAESARLDVLKHAMPDADKVARLQALYDCMDPKGFFARKIEAILGHNSQDQSPQG